MSKVNFVSEFNAFMRYARDNSLSLRERMLWIALFYIANDRAVYNEHTQEYEWPDDFIQVSHGELNLYCCLDKRAIETLRNALKQKGLIDFQAGQKNKKKPAYRINYLSAMNVGYKNAPNPTPNNVPNNVPNNTPNNTPNNAENAPMLGTKMHPTIPPYPKYKYINQNSFLSGENVPTNQSTYLTGTDGGFVNLHNAAPECEGFVPLPWEEGNS